MPGWYLTDIPLNGMKESMHYGLNLREMKAVLHSKWKYVGKTFHFKTDNGEYREDGSIIYKNETDAYRRIWFMSLYSDIEEMCVITDSVVLVLPSFLNNDGNAKFFEYSYTALNGNIKDAVTQKDMNVVAFMHTHPNGSAPSRRGGDGSFMAAHFPFKPNYVLMIKKNDINRSSISFIIGSENPYTDENGFSGYHFHLDENLTIPNLIKKPGGYFLRKFTIQNKLNFKKLIPKYQSK